MTARKPKRPAKASTKTDNRKAFQDVVLAIDSCNCRLEAAADVLEHLEDEFGVLDESDLPDRKRTYATMILVRQALRTAHSELQGLVEAGYRACHDSNAKEAQS